MNTKTVWIIGYGGSGRAAERLAVKLGYSVVIFDDKLSEKNAENAESAQKTPEFAIVSPGVALKSPLLAECRRRNVRLISELQFGCTELKRRGWKLLAITGSKGKSSVVKAVAAAVDGVPCGNYGLPVSELALRDEPGWAVVEVSSFQLETTDLPRDTFEAAAVLNLQEDHLDRHGDIAVYHALKRKLLTMTAHAIDGTVPADAAVRDEAADLLKDTYFDTGVLRENGVVAVRLLTAIGVERARIRSAFVNFAALPHRMQTVGVFRGVRCIDDSKATSIAALVAGVEMAAKFGPVRLIAGGQAKGDDPAIAGSVLTKYVKKVYLIGTCAQHFAEVWSEFADCEIVKVMETAVAAAMQAAEPGEVLLLSPGTASFDQFSNFGKRGDVFAELVKQQG